LERICDINKYYKEINEALIILSDIEMKSDEKFHSRYQDDEDSA
jgi:hypothetical protein